MSATQARITKRVFCEWSWHRLWCRSCESACLAPMWLGSKPGPSVISALRFRVVGSRPCSEEIFSGFSSFPLSTKIGIAKFQLDGDLSQSTLDARGLLACQRRGVSEPGVRASSACRREFFFLLLRDSPSRLNSVAPNEKKTSGTQGSYSRNH